MGHTLIFPLSSLRAALHSVDAAREEANRLVPRFLRTSLIALLVAVSYYAGTTLGIFLKPDHTSMATFWPPSAILLAALLLARTRMWWIFLLAILPAHLVAQLQAGATVPNALSWFVGNAGGALIGAVCIRHFRKTRLLFDSVQGFVIFLIFGVLVAPVLKSFLDAAMTILIGRSTDYWVSWTTRLTSNMIANLIIVPTIVIFGVNGISWFRRASFARYLEAGFLAVGIVVVSQLVFSRESAAVSMPVFIYAPLPLLLWAALRFGTGGLSASMLVVALTSAWNAMHGRGPFGNLSLADHVLSLHILLTVFALPLMLTAGLIAERRRGDETLREARCKLVDAQEQERLRIARELHDDIVQQLTMVGLSVDELRSGFNASAKTELDKLYDQISVVSKATRDLSHDLYPFTLEYLGLAGGLRKLCRDTGAKSGLTINFSEKDVPSDLPSDISHCFFRVAQEALQNIVKHSHARAASMELKVRGGQVLLRIVDDGIGITPEQHHSGGMGLASMRERVWALEGTCKVTSGPLKGTTVEATVPLKKESQAHLDV
jgi:signal transduction histidine kinase